MDFFKVFNKIFSATLLAFVFALNTNIVLAQNLVDISKEKPLLQFHLSPEQPKVGESVKLFTQADLSLTKHEIFLEFFQNGIHISPIRASESLWILNFAPFTEIKTHFLEAKVYIRDQKESNRIQKAIALLQEEILNLENAIDQEQDPIKLEALEAELERKEAYLEELELALDNLKVFFKVETFIFDTLPDPVNQNFPILSTITPSLGQLAGGTLITLTGANFGINPIVRIGGQAASVLSATSTSIEAITSSSSTGIKDVEVSFVEGSQTKNSILKNSFFVTSEGTLNNLRPVAVTSGYQIAQKNGDIVTLDGSVSYDENGDGLTYTWKILAAAKNSSFVPGTFLPSVPQPTFDPDKKGTFVFELKVRENNTAELLESEPAIAVVGVE